VQEKARQPRLGGVKREAEFAAIMNAPDQLSRGLH
jgi:hypothetical protein